MRERLCDTLKRAGGTLDFSGMALPKADVPKRPAHDLRKLENELQPLYIELGRLQADVRKGTTEASDTWPREKALLDHIRQLEHVLKSNQRT